MMGVCGIAAISAWNFFQTRRAVTQEHQIWVKRVSAMIVAERQSFGRWIDRFPVQRHMIAAVAASDPDVAALAVVDATTHKTERWIRSPRHARLQQLDPRVVVLELKALENRETQMGPLLFEGKTPYCTVVRPLDQHRVLIAFIQAKAILALLEDESRLWHLHCFVYDYEQHPIFSSGNAMLVRPFLRATIENVRAGVGMGLVSLDFSQAFHWLVSFHYDPPSDWVFIIGEPARWAFAPAVLFLISLAGILILARLPWRAETTLTRAHWSQQLGQFANRVDNFVHGRDVMLNEPPYPFKELVPIVHALRWLMPQWKKAEAFPRELALDKKLLSMLVETLPEGILFFNAQGNLQLSNELGRVFLGLQQESGREIKMINGIQVPRGFLEIYVEPIFTGQQRNMGKEVEVAWADGKHLYRIWVESVEESEGVTSGFIVVIRDITFRKQWEYVQEQVLSGITHDLRGPLSAVMGYLDLMRRQLKEGPPKVIEYLGLARDAGVRLTQMVSDILDVVRFEQGKIELQPAAISVGEIFQRLHNIFNVTADQKKVSLQLKMSGPPDMATWGDPKLLERVLDNLVGNAIKFTPSSGVITVTAQRGPGRVIFEVADTGRGIPREAQSRIFDKFQQVRPGDRSAGYGLGLAVAKFIVEAHKGEIRVESEVGVGSRFTFWIPDQPAFLESNPASATA